MPAFWGFNGLPMLHIRVCWGSGGRGVGWFGVGGGGWVSGRSDMLDGPRVRGPETVWTKRGLGQKLSGQRLSFFFLATKVTKIVQHTAQPTVLKTHSTSRKWSATTSAVGGVEPSAAAQHLRSNKEREKALAAMRVHHQRSEQNMVDFLMSSGSDLALAAASEAKNCRDSLDHRPPTSQPKTTSRARPCCCASSG